MTREEFMSEYKRLAEERDAIHDRYLDATFKLVNLAWHCGTDDLPHEFVEIGLGRQCKFCKVAE